MKKTVLLFLALFITAQPAWSNVFYENSLRCEKKGDYKQSLEEWKEAQYTVTENVFNQRLAWLEYLMHHYDAALTYYEKAFDSNKKDITSGLGIINCLYALKEYEQACDFSVFLFKKFPDNVSVRRALSNSLFYAGKYVRQIRLAEKFASDRVINTTKGWSLYNQGKYNSAKDFFRTMRESAETQEERQALWKAAYECEQMQQFDFGMYFTNIQYGLGLPDKRVLNGVFLYAPHKWNQYRFIYSNTETSDTSFGEDALNIGFTGTFRHDYKSLFDFYTFSSNDPLTDDGRVYSFQLLKKINSRFTAGLEYDYSNYDMFNVNQFSPKIYCQIDRKTGIEVKTYFIDHSENTLYSGDNQAFSVKLNRYLRKNLHLNTLFWAGEKRLSVESDKSYVYNSLDLYESGYALGLDYSTKRNLAFSLGYSRNRFKSFAVGSSRTHAGLWTFGMKLRN